MTRDGRINFALATLVVVALVAVGAAASNGNPPTPLGRSVPRTANACPLPPAQERTAVDAFKKMMPVLTHPRCFNCHGGVNPFVSDRLGGHVGDVQPAGEPRDCTQCHGKLRKWDTPGAPMLWIGKGARELCAQFKDMTNGPAYFIGHMFNDRGGTQFIATAFLGDRALTDFGKATLLNRAGREFALEPPPINHAELMVHARTWANAVGTAGWRATPECGCGVTAKAWVGTVTTAFQTNLGPGSLGTLRENVSATVRFEMDSTFSRPDRYWKAASGAITWTTSATGGACTGGGAGTVPIGLGSDGNPMAHLRFVTAGSETRFTVGLGPLPDVYEPRIKYRCPDAPSLGMFSLLGAAQWWGHPPTGGTLSPDGKTMTGSYRTATGQGTIEWNWDLHLETFVRN